LAGIVLVLVWRSRLSPFYNAQAFTIYNTGKNILLLKFLTWTEAFGRGSFSKSILQNRY